MISVKYKRRIFKHSQFDWLHVKLKWNHRWNWNFTEKINNSCEELFVNFFLPFFFHGQITLLCKSMLNITLNFVINKINIVLVIHNKYAKKTIHVKNIKSYGFDCLYSHQFVIKTHWNKYHSSLLIKLIWFA